MLKGPVFRVVVLGEIRIPINQLNTLYYFSNSKADSKFDVDFDDKDSEFW